MSEAERKFRRALAKVQHVHEYFGELSREHHYAVEDFRNVRDNLRRERSGNA